MLGAIFFILLFILVFFIFANFLIVKVNHIVVLVNPIGKFSRVFKEGINFTYPWEFVKHVKWTYSNQDFKQNTLNIYELPIYGQQIDIAPIECATFDELIVSIDFLIVYKVDNAERALFSNEDTLSLLVQQVNKYARILINKYTSKELRANEKTIAEKIVSLISDEWTPKFGLSLTNCEIQNISTDEDTIRRRRQFRDGISPVTQAHIEQAIALGQGKNTVLNKIF